MVSVWCQFAQLNLHIIRMNRIYVRRKQAFALCRDAYANVDLLICNGHGRYPEMNRQEGKNRISVGRNRLWDYIEVWLAAGECHN